uniref:Uncharacterized protein n=1 Tax=Percolomonas cosmopolitus TaxID=63605 RepID=A0A7S1PJ68_9EUKA
MSKAGYSLLRALYTSIFIRQPTSLLLSRILYVHYLIIGFFVAVLAANGIFGLLELSDTYKNEYCRRYFEIFYVSCQGFFSVHRVGFSLAVFFGVFFVLASLSSYFSFCMCFGVSSVDDGPGARLDALKRSDFRIGLERILLMLHTNVLTFLPKGVFFVLCMGIPWLVPDVFFFGWSIVSMIGATLFLLVQILIIIHFAHAWFEAWIGKESPCRISIWHALILFFAFLFFSVGIVMTGLMIWLYGSRPQCHLNRVFIISTFLCGIPITILSILRGKGILPPSIIFLFATFSCWSAVLSDPDQACNLLAPSNANQITWSRVLTIVVSIAIGLVSLVKAAVSTGSSFSEVILVKRKHSVRDVDDTDSDEDDPMERLKHLLKQRREIYYSLLALILASLYMATTLTNWQIMTPSWDFQFDRSSQSVAAHIAMMIVKLLTVFILYGLFTWSLVAPLIFRHRDFGEDDDSWEK